MNCKPGDLAITIIANHPENVGKIVRVIELVKDFREIAWLIEGNGPGFISYDAWLRPVSGLPDHEDTTAYQPVKETA